MTGTVDEDRGPKITFPRRERRGALLGLQPLQLWVIGIAVGVAILFVAVARDYFWSALLVLLPMAIIGAGTWRREPLIVLLGVVVRFATAQMTGQNEYARDLYITPREEEVNFGRASTGENVPTIASKFRLPGALGAVKIAQVPGRGALVVNSRARTVSVTVLVNSRAWRMVDVADRHAAYNGFVDWMASLDTPGLKTTVARIRVDAAPTTELEDYAAARDAVAPVGVPARVVESYAALVHTGSSTAMEVTNLVTLTFDVSKMKAEVRGAGGGLVGIGAVMGAIVDSLEGGLTAARLSMSGWLDAAAIDSVLARSTDPIGFAERTSRRPGERRTPPVHPPVMGVRNRWRSLTIDGTEHVTYWIAEWPRRERPVGFLDPLLYAGNATRVVTLEMKALPIDKALTEVERAQMDLAVARVVREKFQMRTTSEQAREEEEVSQREDELADGFSELRFRGYVTVSAGSPEELGRAKAELRTAARGARVALALAYGRQAAAFVTAVLPVGMGGGK